MNCIQPSNHTASLKARYQGIKNRHHAAKTIQRFARGFLLRNKLVDQENLYVDKRGSIWIWRDESSFTKKCHLTSQEKKKVQPYLAKLSKLPKASMGQIPVSLTEEFVIKECDNPEERLEKIEMAHLLAANEGYKYLKIPRASVIDGKLVAERIPITHPTIFQQIGLYTEKKEEVTKAIMEFIHFHLSLPLHHLFTNNDKLSDFFFHRRLPHYDNFPFFKDPKDNKYKIALVDLERGSTDIREELNKRDLIGEYQKLSNLFPLHLNKIMPLAEKLGYQFSTRGVSDVMLFFNLLYKNHKKYLQKHQITPENPHFENLSISKERKIELAQNLKKTLLHIHKKDLGLKGFLGSKSKITAFTQEMFDQTIQTIIDILKSSVQPVKIQDYPHLVESRHFLLDSATESSKLQKILSPLFQKSTEEWKELRLAYLLFSSTLRQFSEHEIFHYHERTINQRKWTLVLL